MSAAQHGTAPRQSCLTDDNDIIIIIVAARLRRVVVAVVVLSRLVSLWAEEGKGGRWAKKMAKQVHSVARRWCGR